MARLNLKTPADVLTDIGQSARELRLYRNLTQTELAERADVGVRTLQRLETTGRASMDAVVRVAFALGVEGAFAQIFVRPAAKTIDEVLEKKVPTRKRARGSK